MKQHCSTHEIFFSLHCIPLRRVWSCLFFNPWQTVESVLNKLSLLRPFSFDVLSVSPTCFSNLLLSLPPFGTCTSPEHHLWDCRKAHHKALQNDNFCLPDLSAFINVAKPTMSTYYALGTLLVPVAHEGPSCKAVCQSAPTSAAAVGHPVIGAQFGTCLCLNSGIFSISSSVHCPWIWLWLKLLQSQNQLFIAVKSVHLIACYRVLKAFGRNQLWTWYTNLVKSGFLIPASPERLLMNGFISQQGFPRKR